MSATGHRPICQDTGIVNVFLKVGMDVRFEGFGTGSLDDAINEGVRRGYNHPDNTLRASVVADPLFARKNTKDHTPEVISTQIVPGHNADFTVATKGCRSANKPKIYMFTQQNHLNDWGWLKGGRVGGNRMVRCQQGV